MSVFDQIKPPEVIYEASSKYNKDIKIVKVGRTIRLMVDDSVYSVNHDSPACDKLFLGKTVSLIKREAPDIKDILILGMGGGTMAKLISLKFPGISIVSVDIDPMMVEIGKKFFGLDTVPNHRVIIDDAFRVVVEPKENELLNSTFDAIVVDLFIGNDTPSLIRTGNFLSALKRLAAPGALIIFNKVYTTPEYQEDANLFAQQLESYFQNVNSEIVPGYTNSDNILIYGKA